MKVNPYETLVWSKYNPLYRELKSRPRQWIKLEPYMVGGENGAVWPYKQWGSRLRSILHLKCTRDGFFLRTRTEDGNRYACVVERAMEQGR